MAFKDQEFLAKLLATFKVEAEDHLSTISSGLMELERAPSTQKQLEIVETIFREAHSLKGASRAVNLREIESVCQELETLFSALKSKEVVLSAETFDLLHSMVETVGGLLSSQDHQAVTADVSHDAGSSVAGDMPAGDILPPLPAPEAPPPERGGPCFIEPQSLQAAGNVKNRQLSGRSKSGLSETVRVPAFKLDSLLLQAEELISTKETGVQRLAELCEILVLLGEWEREWKNIRPLAHAIRQHSKQRADSHSSISGLTRQERFSSEVLRVLAFLERNETVPESAINKISLFAKSLEQDNRLLARRATGFLEELKAISMLRFSSVLGLFPKLVRDLCRDCGKEAELEIGGGEIEVDRRILEEMKEPLIHLVRNCIDHGIESPKERERKGKRLRAKITIAICHKSDDKAELLISDDGAGIDTGKVLASAVKSGLVSKDRAQSLDGREALSLIFQSGLSTSPLLTDVSGRGLGLAIVREKAEKLGGAISVETHLGLGTIFRIILPLRLATFRGILVKVGQAQFVIPTMQVKRVIRVSRDAVKTAENQETIQVDEQAVSLLKLSDALEISPAESMLEARTKHPAVLLSWAGDRVAFLVDEVLNEQEVLVKSLGKQLRHVRNIAGAAVLGTGRVVPVLNVADLFQSAALVARAGSSRQAEPLTKSVLVAEDSITARTLLKSILQSAGYRVKTAVNGVEAFDVVRNEECDLVVSDVEMPGMNGFDLTEKIRADKNLSGLPIVLVTALESRQDRERGAQVGANAYIVKSSFNQINLLEVVRRLI